MRYLVPLMVAMGLFGCGDRAERYEAPLTLLSKTPVALDKHLAYVDVGLDRALFVDVSGERPGRRRRAVDLPVNVIHAEARLAADGSPRDELLVLSRGQRDEADQAPEHATLVRLRPGGDVVRYDLTSTPFDSLAQSPDGRHVLLWRTAQGQRLLQSSNVVAVVDLDADPDEAVRSYTVDFRTTGVVFSPPMPIGGEPRALALALSNGGVTLLDLDHPERLRLTTVTLSIDNDRTVQPTQVVFDPDHARIYLRAESSRDVFALRLTPRQVSDERNDFATAVDILATDGTATDMALYGQGEAQRLLVLSNEVGRAVASIVEPSTSRTTSIPLDGLSTRITLFERTAAGASGKSALLWQPGTGFASVLSLSVAEQQGARALQALPPLAQPIARVLSLEEAERLLLVHDTPGLSLMEPDTLSVAPFAASTQFDDAVFDIEGGRVWVAPAYQDRVGFVELDGGATDELRLDAEVQALVPVLSQDRLAITHPDETGHMTLVDVSAPQRSTLVRLQGFLLTGL